MKSLLVKFFSFVSPERLSKKDQPITQDELGELLDYLLTACDIVAAQTAESTFDGAENYQDHDQSERAYSLVKRYLKQHPDDLELIELLAELLRENGDLSQAIETYEMALALEPQNQEVLYEYSLTLIQNLQFDEGIRQLEKAKSLNFDTEFVSTTLIRANNLANWYAQAEEPASMPSIELDQCELENQQFHPETLTLATALYRRHGTLLIGNAFITQI